LLKNSFFYQRFIIVEKLDSSQAREHLDRIGRADSFVFGKELVGENRGIDRILRRLKLHAEGRQFGG
jgi:hypothetical protein